MSTELLFVIFNYLCFVGEYRLLADTE